MRSNYFKLLLTFLLNGPHKSTAFDFFLNFDFEIFHDFFSVFVNMGTYEREHSHHYSFKLFQTSPQFSSLWSSLNSFDFFEMVSYRLLSILFSGIFTFTIKTYREIKNCNYLENEPWNLMDIKGKYSIYTACFFQLSVQGHSEVTRCISDFRQPFISKTASRRAK